MVSSVRYSNPAEEKTKFDHNIGAITRKKKTKTPRVLGQKWDKKWISEGLFLSDTCSHNAKKEFLSVVSAADSAALMAIL